MKLFIYYEELGLEIKHVNSYLYPNQCQNKEQSQFRENSLDKIGSCKNRNHDQIFYKCQTCNAYVSLW